MYNREYLLGANKYNELVFIDVRIDNDNQLSVSFDCVRPFKESDVNIFEYIQEFYDCMGVKDKLDILERLDCKPSEVADKLYDENSDIQYWIDCSLYPEWYTIDEDVWYFESSSCGQCECKDGMTIYTDKIAFDRLYQIWKEYHLTIISNELINEVDILLNRLDKINEAEWIIDYIKRTF